MNIPNCIRCDKTFENITDDTDVNQPMGGTSFMSHGHFGSGVYDPMDPKVWLEINICDECLAQRQEQVLHATRLDKSFTVPVAYEKWNRYKHG